MSDLSKPKEAAEWIHAWETSKISPERWLVKVTEAHASLKASLVACEATGRWPSPWKSEEVRASVELLKGAADRATRQAH